MASSFPSASAAFTLRLITTSSTVNLPKPHRSSGGLSPEMGYCERAVAKSLMRPGHAHASPSPLKLGVSTTSRRRPSWSGPPSGTNDRTARLITSSHPRAKGLQWVALCRLPSSGNSPFRPRPALCPEADARSGRRGWAADLSMVQLRGSQGRKMGRLRTALKRETAKREFARGWKLMERDGGPTLDAEAVRSLRKAADFGFAPAQRALGWAYAEGRGVPIDDAESVRLYSLAVNQGDVRAQVSLGWMYEMGRGVRRDDARATELYASAAQNGSAEAQCYLGWMNETVRGGANDSEAAEWYKKAAAQGYARAQHNLGVLFYHGRGVPQDREQAAALYLKAGSQGYAEARLSIGQMHRDGYLVARNKAEAALWQAWLHPDTP